ncbi:TPA: hypothetical protein ACJKHM_000698 [Neisseria meningitidis]
MENITKPLPNTVNKPAANVMEKATAKLDIEKSGMRKPALKAGTGSD